MTCDSACTTACCGDCAEAGTAPPTFPRWSVPPGTTAVRSPASAHSNSSASSTPAPSNHRAHLPSTTLHPGAPARLLFTSAARLAHTGCVMRARPRSTGLTTLSPQDPGGALRRTSPSTKRDGARRAGFRSLTGRVLPRRTQSREMRIISSRGTTLMRSRPCFWPSASSCASRRCHPSRFVYSTPRRSSRSVTACSAGSAGDHHEL